MVLMKPAVSVPFQLTAHTLHSWWRQGVQESSLIHFPARKSDSAGKESTCNAGNLGSIPGLGRSPGEG